MVARPRRSVANVAHAVAHGAKKVAREEREIQIAADVATLVEQMSGENGVIARLTAMEKELDEITAMSNRWKGVTIALLALGSFGGWVIAGWDKFKGLVL